MAFGGYKPTGRRSYRERRVDTHRLVTGDQELDEVLRTLKAGLANRVVRPAVKKGARHLDKSNKKNLPSKYKHLRQAFGWRVDNKGGKARKEPQAKIGAAVGRAYQKPARRSGLNRGKGSVGISGRNVHWIILGTKDRYHKSGKWVGKMPAILKLLIPMVFTGERHALRELIRKDVADRIENMVKDGRINSQSFENT